MTASSTHEKACFSQSGCGCCDLRTSQSCPRLAHELSRAGAGGAAQAFMVSFEPERIMHCAGECQTLQPWPVQSHRAASGWRGRNGLKERKNKNDGAVDNKQG